MAVELRTFGRCAENAGKCLTFGRWERSAGRWNAAVWGSGGGTAFTHLRKVCGKCGKVPHLRKVGKVRWEVERGSMGFWRRYCVYSPSEGVRKMRESASPSEGGKGPLGGGTRQYGVLEAVLRLLTFGRCAENAGKCLTFGRWNETVPLRQRVTDLRKVGCSGVKRRHGHRRVSQRAYRKVNISEYGRSSATQSSPRGGLGGGVKRCRGTISYVFTAR